jgi:hypothetical protein
MGLSGQRHAPAALHSRERTPGTHYIGGWVGLGAGMDTKPDTILTELPRLPIKLGPMHIPGYFLL